MNVYSVTLSGPSPWGFRLQGGKDFSMPLTVSRLTPGGKAAQAGVGVGDWVVSINDANAEDMTHVEAQNTIRAAEDSLTLTLTKAFKSGDEQKCAVCSPSPTFFQGSFVPASVQPKYSFAPSTTINKMAKPFTAGDGSANAGFPIKPVAYSPKLNTPHSQAHASMRQPQNGLEPTQSPAVAQAADKPDGSMTAVATGGHSGPSSRPPWVTDPSFANRFRPDKTSTVMTQHQQPAQPTPMENRSSILQAAQQAPEDTGRTPVCGACNKIIRGRYLVALGRSWHPEEFTCSQCKKVLDEGGFFEERGSVYCTKCYDNRYAPNCAKCKKKITGEIMHALKMTYHVQCFKCAACKTAIRNQAFYMEEGEPYCERDYEKMFGTKCHGCDFKIDAGDRFLEALGYSWHDTCFVCALCQINLEGKTFYSKKDKPLCKSHAFAPV
ncbi:PDZ and LIM domain protein 7 isoform X1 [Takifugu flavidus]|uniref:PDZ and LIM domain protein 7 isoform X1 n=1 Tax=Takifugu flavidus TaxID=433684 RepID=UPI0025442952|nr:PDZ and LIM domain protein 7 isoform X1 [Takifugu flavidus]XP_056899137.1 PDZ and LIM domain protein 7 isoform X1 [Takifugu flavidus]